MQLNCFRPHVTDQPVLRGFAQLRKIRQQHATKKMSVMLEIRYMTTVVAPCCQVAPWLIPVRHECKVSPFPLLEVLDTHGSTFTPNAPCPPDPPHPHASHLGHQASRLQS